MDKIVITGVRPYDGSYDLDLSGDQMTTLEWRWIKKISGYLPMSVEDGWKGRDPDLFLAFAVIAMVRAGKIDADQAIGVASVIELAPRSAIKLELGEEEESEAADPPEAASGPQSEPQKTSGGGSSSQTSDLPDSDPSPTGRPVSLRSVTSDLATSAT